MYCILIAPSVDILCIFTTVFMVAYVNLILKKMMMMMMMLYNSGCVRDIAEFLPPLRVFGVGQFNSVIDVHSRLSLVTMVKKI